MIIFLYGEDTYRSREKLKELRDKFIRDVDPSGNSVVMIDGGKTTLDKFNEAVAAPSLFAKRRMIVIDGIFENKSKTVQDAIFDYFRKKEKNAKGKSADDNIIVFRDGIGGEKHKANKLFKLLLKQQFVQDFKPLSNTQAAEWVKRAVGERGGSIRNEAAVHLVSLFGSDLWRISNEVNKLVNFKRGQQPELLADGQEVLIEVADVDNLVRGSADENIFALTDAISQKNKSLALKLFEQEIEAGVTESYLITMITRQFRILLQVREALNQGHTNRKMLSLLKLHPFVIQKATAQVRNFPLETLKAIMNELVAIDYRMKTGRADAKSGLSLLIAKI